ncbi:Ebp2p, partial [Ascoidea rubescens DSM 1968]
MADSKKIADTNVLSKKDQRKNKKLTKKDNRKKVKIVKIQPKALSSSEDEFESASEHINDDDQIDDDSFNEEMQIELAELVKGDYKEDNESESEDNQEAIAENSKLNFKKLENSESEEESGDNEDDEDDEEEEQRNLNNSKIESKPIKKDQKSIKIKKTTQNKLIINKKNELEKSKENLDQKQVANKTKENDDENKDQDEDMPLSDVELDSDTDVVPHTKLTVNNQALMRESLQQIQFPWEKLSFQEHQSITSNDIIQESINDIYDDDQRENAFNKQGLLAVIEARKKLIKLKVPFSRPADYFAEMVKNDEHMNKLKAKLIEEAKAKKASENAKKQRQLKKFGKQVQIATMQERQKQKKETLDKIKNLKKKRKT